MASNRSLVLSFVSGLLVCGALVAAFLLGRDSSSQPARTLNGFTPAEATMQPASTATSAVAVDAPAPVAVAAQTAPPPQQSAAVVPEQQPAVAPVQPQVSASEPTRYVVLYEKGTAAPVTSVQAQPPKTEPTAAEKAAGRIGNNAARVGERTAENIAGGIIGSKIPIPGASSVTRGAFGGLFGGGKN